MDHSAWRLFPNHDELSLNPQHPHKKAGMVTYTYHSDTREGTPGVGWPATVAEHSMRDFISGSKMVRDWEEHWALTSVFYMLLHAVHRETKSCKEELRAGADEIQYDVQECSGRLTIWVTHWDGVWLYKALSESFRLNISLENECKLCNRSISVIVIY